MASQNSHFWVIQAPPLKYGIFLMLSLYNLEVQFIRGQGYGGASDMWIVKWFASLVSNQCLYPYCIHCFVCVACNYH